MKNVVINDKSGFVFNDGLSLSNLRKNLQADCQKCFGLCCVALYFSSSEGFPADKAAGHPCPNLSKNFSCNVHESLMERGLKGCVAFDCFGAGQKVAQYIFCGNNWSEFPENKKEMFEVFLKIRQLQELLWYLTEVLMHKSTSPIHTIACSLIREVEDVTYLDPYLLIEFDIVGLRSKVNDILVKASELIRAEVIDKIKIQTKHKKTMGKKIDFIGAKLRNSNLNGANLRGAFLIAADLRNADFSYADLIGADFRDADVRGANLSKSIFLTQAQVNSSKGDKSTKLPELLIRPKYWNTG